MTVTEAMAALCLIFGSWNNAGSGSHDISCSADQLSVASVSNYWIPTTQQLTDMVAGFNAVSTAAGSSPPAALDTLGTFLAVISNQETGNHALTFASHQLTVANSSYIYSASGSQLGTLATDFNALQTAFGGAGGSPFATGGTFARGFVIGGQSLMANWGGAASSPSYYTLVRPGQAWQINPQTGALGAMTVPQAGVSGSLDSFVPRLADTLLANVNLAHVVVGNIAIGGTTFSQFAKGGSYNASIAATLGYFTAQSLKVSCVLWGQGESDASNNTSAATVQAQVMSIADSFRAVGYIGPIIFARETISQNSTQPGTTNVVTGITNAVALLPNTFVGPDVDALLGSADRYDGTHPNYSGESKLATAWKTAMTTASCLP